MLPRSIWLAIEPEINTDTFSSRFASDADTSRVVAAPSPRSNSVEYSRIAKASDRSPNRAGPSSRVIVGTDNSPASSGMVNPTRLRNELRAIGPNLLINRALRPESVVCGTCRSAAAHPRRRLPRLRLGLRGNHAQYRPRRLSGNRETGDARQDFLSEILPRQERRERRLCALDRCHCRARDRIDRVSPSSLSLIHI